MANRLYRLKDAAEILAVTRQTLYRLHSQGQIAFVRIGRAVRISEAEIARVIDGGKR